MINKTVYLAGPISGLTYQQATGWRDAVTAELIQDNIKCLSPLRSGVHLRDHDGLLTDCEIAPGLEPAVKAMSTKRGVVARDLFDVTKCNILLVYLLGATSISIGTCVEIGWAHANHIPIIVVMEKYNIHNHAFITETASFVVNTLNDAVHIAKSILSAY